jgi:hypothetical protein
MLAAEQHYVAASRKREVTYSEMKRGAARRASATGERCWLAGPVLSGGYTLPPPACLAVLTLLPWHGGGLKFPTPVSPGQCPNLPLLLASPSPPEHLVFLLNFVNTSAALLAPCAIILHTRAELLPGFALTMSTCILWLKLVSYAHVNWDYRCVCVVCVCEKGSTLEAEGLLQALGKGVLTLRAWRPHTIPLSPIPPQRGAAPRRGAPRRARQRAGAGGR